MHWTAILDSEVEVVAIPLKFRVRTLTWKGIPFQRSYWELRIYNFWVQKERAIKTGISNPAPGELLSVQL